VNSKIINGALGLIIGLVVLSDSNTISAHAANWHKGTPTSLQGKWQSKWHRDSKTLRTRTRTTISKRSIDSGLYNSDGTGDMGEPDAIGASYKYLGKHIYQIRGKEMTGTWTFKAKKCSHTKIELFGRDYGYNFKMYLYRR